MDVEATRISLAGRVLLTRRRVYDVEEEEEEEEQGRWPIDDL